MTMPGKRNLQNDVDHFLSFISEDGKAGDEGARRRLLSFFSEGGHARPMVVHEGGDLFFYADGELADAASLKGTRIRGGISRFDGSRISAISPSAIRKEYHMISGKKRRGSGSTSYDGGVSSNNNNNNNNNNNG